MSESLKLVAVGGLGLMLSPAAEHLTAAGCAQVLRVHDRGAVDERRDQCRLAWQAHGAELVDNYPALIGNGQIDGVVICAGKNGDDAAMLQEIVSLLAKQAQQPFILHLSTLSARFVRAAAAFCQPHGVAYANYPLTGGPSGARAATMLVLASGDQALYQRLLPMLETLGRPRYFGNKVDTGAAVKLMGHCMVFNGLNGISSAAALYQQCLDKPLVGDEATEFFDFLNQGAGGTRQWEVALRNGVHDNQWEQGFMIKHAATDAIYAAELAIEQQLPLPALLALLNTALALGYMAKQYPDSDLATHSLVKGFLSEHSAGLDAHIRQHLQLDDMPQSLLNCIAALPADYQQAVGLVPDFASSV